MPSLMTRALKTYETSRGATGTLPNIGVFAAQANNHTIIVETIYNSGPFFYFAFPAITFSLSYKGYLESGAETNYRAIASLYWWRQKS